MGVFALLLVSVALLQTSYSESSYETSFPQEDFAEAYPMETPDSDNRVLVEQDVEDEDADAVVSERSEWSPVEGQGEKLERLMEKWTQKPATDLAQHPAGYGGHYGGTGHGHYGGTGHGPHYASGHHEPAPAKHLHPDAYTSGAHYGGAHYGGEKKSMDHYASGHHAYMSGNKALQDAHKFAETHHAAAVHGPATLEAVLSVVSFTLNMPVTPAMFKTKKTSLIAALSKKLGLPPSEIKMFFEEVPVDADLDDVLLEEEATTGGVKVEVKHKSKDAAAAKAQEAKIAAGAKKVADGKGELAGIKVPKQTPKMKVKEEKVKAPLKKSGVSSTMPNFVALVVVGLTSLWYF